MFGEELEHGCVRLEQLLASYPVRGLKGATGTQLDQLTLFDGDTVKVAELEQKIQKKNEVVAELLEEHVQLKKARGEL